MVDSNLLAVLLRVLAVIDFRIIAVLLVLNVIAAFIALLRLTDSRMVSCVTLFRDIMLKGRNTVPPRLAVEETILARLGRMVCNKGIEEGAPMDIVVPIIAGKLHATIRTLIGGEAVRFMHFTI